MAEPAFLPAEIDVLNNVRVPMRDGVELSTDIYFPTPQEGPFPVILARTPYDNMSDPLIDSAVFFAQNGYVFAAQDCRGRNDSDGRFNPWIQEYEDGHDTIEWLGSQDWCDGNVGMHGASYPGGVQWMAAVMGSPYLKAIVPRVIGDDLHGSLHYQGGAFTLHFAATWSFRMGGRTWQLIDRFNWKRIFSVLPLRAIPAFGGKDLDFFQDWLDHPDYDEYWKSMAIKEQYEKVKIPALQIGGWYDIFAGGTMNNFVGMQQRGGSELARSHQRVVIGPWHHHTNTETHAGEIDFGKASVVDVDEIQLRWYDHWLKGVDNGVDKDPPLRIYTMGANEWRDEHEWPLARTEFTPWYFHSGGSANSLLGDGTLSAEPPEDEPADEYVYNPAFPTPTLGGATCCTPEIVDWGSFDQRAVEYRDDVLVYTSAPLEADLEVTGPVVVKLFAGTDGRDTDFTAKLVDVHPDGFARNLCDGIIRGRYRQSPERQMLLEADEVYEFTIDLWVTSNVFRKGHRVRVEVSSSNFPRFARNLNTGNPAADDDQIRVARQSVHHDTIRPSHIVLPVIPPG
ncbi:MAG: CocE/NonD family hydrolase [bacterium]|nr:CocE/NonD family hydrolase [bacterium]